MLQETREKPERAGGCMRCGDYFSAPDWLISVFSSLVQGHTINSICDPWAGTGMLMRAMQEATQAENALAIVPSRLDAETGRALVRNAEWQVGSPIDFLSSQGTEIDLVSSLLPWGVKAAKALTVKGTGGNIEIRDVLLGHQILAASALRLGATGIGLFVVTPSFFSLQNSVLGQFGALGLGLDAALALPAGTFAPRTSIPCYLVVVRNHAVSVTFVAELSSDSSANRLVCENFARGQEGRTLELGRFVPPLSFRGLDLIRVEERIKHAEGQFGTPAVPLGALATVINLGRSGGVFQFPRLENAIFIPLIGISNVLSSLDDLTLKPQNYAQVALDPARSNARYMAQFLNSEFGKEIRTLSKSGVFIPKLNKQTLKELRVFVPDLQSQEAMLNVEARIAAEQNMLMGLKSELWQIQRELWSKPQLVKRVEEHLSDFSKRLSKDPKQFVLAGLDQWFETLPFPLASILRAWQATPSKDFKTKYEHLLHFFEATAEFVSIVLLSAFKSNPAFFQQHKEKLNQALVNANLSFRRSTFGTWKIAVEYLGKQTRSLLSGSSEESSLCAAIYSDRSNVLPTTLSKKELAGIFSETIKMRNDWKGHDTALNREEASRRNEQLLGKVQELREVMADIWLETQLIQSDHCVMRNGVYDNEVALLMGSNSAFLKESRAMSTCLDAELLYLSKKDSPRPLQLLPLVQIGPSPQSANNACYFYSRVDKEGFRFVSYHFIDQPERNVRSDMLASLDDLCTEM